MLAAAALLVIVGLVPPISLPGYILTGTTIDASDDCTTQKLALKTQDALYNGRYQEAADLALALRAQAPDSPVSYELRASALLFLLKHELGDHKDGGGRRPSGDEACSMCAAWLSDFRQDIKMGQSLARSVLEHNPSDVTALYFLGKLNLTYLWLELGVLDRRTGWSEFWEAKRSIDTVLREEPSHVRAHVARAWTDYIVGSSLPPGTRWLLGGGNRARALRRLREIAATDAPFFDQAEARFGLWEMEQRESHVDEAITVARLLARDFPNNREVGQFLKRHESRVFPVMSPALPQWISVH